MKVLNKIKSIYLLAIVALLSFCMLLFPAMPKTASAEETGAMGTGNIDIKSAQVQIQTGVGGVDSAFGVEMWAIMFKAEISQKDYNAITDEDTADVKFGMLIGPASRLDAEPTFEQLIKEDGAYRYQKISYVGSVAGAGVQKIELSSETNTYVYWGSIRFNDSLLGENKMKAAAVELVAIPYYTDGTNTVVDFDSKKVATPRNILVESYLRQESGESLPINKPISETTAVENYAGKITYAEKDAYVCRSTNRLMVGEKQGKLAPTNLLESATDVAVSGVAIKTTTAKDLYDAKKLANLPKYGQVNVVAYTADGIVVYKAQVAERVIMRVTDTDPKNIKSDTTTKTAVYPEGYDGTADYLAKAYVTINQNTGGISARGYDSIFKVTHSGTSGANVWYYYFKDKYEGLYVLGDNISMSALSAYGYTVVSPIASGTGYINNINIMSKKDAAGAYTGEAWYSRSAYMPPIANAGFLGTFDGRGFTIDTAQQAKYGVFAPIYGATIKNTAFLNLIMDSNWGGICGSAKNATFENVYAKVVSVSNWHGDLSNPVLMNLDKCTLNNFVAEVNAVTENLMTKELIYGTHGGEPKYNIAAEGNSGYGQGKATSGAFSFKTFPHIYRDDAGAIHYVDNPGLSNSTGLKAFMDGGAEEIFGQVFTSATIVTVRANTYISNAKDAFAGTTGNNVYVLGTSPLYVNHEYAKATGTGADHINSASLDPTTKTTVFVNSTLQYKTPILGEGDVPTGEFEYANTNTTSYYKLSTLVDEKGLFTINDDTTYSLGEIILRGKQFRYGTAKVTQMLATPETSELEVRLVTKAGWYDVANAEEMASYVLANAENNIKFDNAYWNVTDAGVVTWKKPLTIA